jgi:kynureninase
MSDPLLKWRDEFPILGDCTYLVSNSLGAMPRGVYDSLKFYADTWASRGVRAWAEGWWDMNIALGNRIGSIINAQQDTVSIHQNISIAMGILLSAMDFTGDRNKVVIEGGIFPSVYYVLRGMLPPHMELVTAPGYDGISVDVQAIIDSIDERTLLVPVSHVLFRSAYILDVKAIIEKAHQVGALVILDGYHATGIIPMDVQDLNADFYMSGVLKWMCGGPGGVFVHARPDHLKTIKPGLTGWMAHQHSFAFEVDDMVWREDAFRLLNGTTAIPSLHAIQPGVEVIAAVGAEAIREKSMRQTALLWQLAEEAGFTVNSPRNAEERGGTLTIDPGHAFEVSRELLARNVVIDYRKGTGIRVSPHFYNTDDEIHFVVEQMKDIIETGAWEKHGNVQSFVT